MDHKTDLGIIGAGPIGLEAASLAASRGLNFSLWERGPEVAENIRRWGHVRLFSPFYMNHSNWSRELFRRESPGHELPPEEAFLTGHQFRSQYLVPLAELPSLRGSIHTSVEVLEIARRGLSKSQEIGSRNRLRHNFLLRLGQAGRERFQEARFVIDASGIYSNPLPCGAGNLRIPGEALFRDRVLQELPDLEGAQAFLAGRRVLLVGSGFSAATVLEQMAKVGQARGGRVFWVFRSRAEAPYSVIPNDPLPYRSSLSRLANRLATNSPDWLEVYPGSEVLGLEEAAPEGLRVTLGNSGRTIQLTLDHIISAVGFQPDRNLYRQLQVHECYATEGPIKLAASLIGGSEDCLDQISPGIELLRNPEPGFYILGNKSYGTSSNFLLRAGLDQVRSVLDDITELLTTENSDASGETVHEQTSHR